MSKQRPQPWEQRQFNDRLNTCRSGHFVLGAGTLATASVAGLATKAHIQKQPIARNFLVALSIVPMAITGISLIPSHLYKSDLRQYQKQYGPQNTQDQRSNKSQAGWILPGVVGSAALVGALSTFPRRWQPAAEALKRSAAGRASMIHGNGTKSLYQYRAFSSAPWVITAGASAYLLNEARKGLWEDTRQVCLLGK